MGQVFDLAIRVQNGSSAIVPEARLCGLMPLALNGVAFEWQVNAASTIEVQGNRYCLFLDGLGPYQSRHIELQWQAIAGKPATEDASSPTYALSPYASPELLGLARSFQQYPEASRVAHIFAWMVNNIAFSGIRRGVDGAEHALTTRQGDCTEHMLLAAELLQRNGFTVRRALGVAQPKDHTRISAAALHNWIEYLDNGKWLVFDSSRRVLGAADNQNYLALLFYEGNRQLDAEPLTIDSSRLKLYLQ